MTSIVGSGERTPVLVVGAGPVGLVAAISLREQGIQVRIVDELTTESKRTYPVILHPRTLRILTGLGLSAALEWRGHTVKRLAIYTEGRHQGTLELPAAGQMASGAMTLPQDVLRQALMQRLSELGTEVEWKTRLTTLEQDPGRARAGLVRRERLPGESYAPQPEWLDVGTESVEAEFVVGADGCKSSVRRLLGIEWRRMGKRQIYYFYDAPDARAGNQAHLVVGSGLRSSIYPLQNDLSRFSFEIGVGMTHAPGAAQLQQLLASRMPWFRGEASQLEWSGSAEFSPAIADRFGEGRVWLAGDAAHSTGPLGAQSLNVGIYEAHDLARRIALERDRSAARTLGIAYTTQRRLEWERLFGVGPSVPLTGRAPDWVRRHITSLLPSLPAAGDDLDDLLDQLHVRSA
jgi:2-polyprenyl-6-methoxyphenol hydroxylase-like FAD-dependent oxidoreductase